jgi:hypothetical protein
MFSPISRRSVALVALTTLLSQVLSPLVPISYANDTAYYIDAVSGSDIADGLTPATAWQSIARVNSGAYLPGDQLLFQCGDTFSGEILVEDSGTLGSPILYGAYGTCTGSNKPIIAPVGTYALSEIGSQSYITIQGIALSGGLSDGSLRFTGSGDSLTIDTIEISNPSGACISIDATENILIQGSTISSCTLG